MENPVLQAIRARRSVRSYKSDPVPRELLETVAEAATWAPSGSNHQTWRFTVVEGKEALAELNEEARVALRDSVPVPGEYPSIARSRERAKDPGLQFFYGAPALIIASNDADYANAMADCAAALQNIFLAAHSLGLGTCWINQLHWLDGNASMRAYLAKLGIPLSHTICGSAAIGYPDGPVPLPPPRKPDTVRFL